MTINALGAPWQWLPWDNLDLVHASLMLSLSGLLAMLVLWQLPASAWGLRSWLIGAVLLQGLMLARSPLHLGILQSPSAPMKDGSIAAGTAQVGTQAMAHTTTETSSERLATPTLTVASGGERASGSLFSNVTWNAVFWSAWAVVLLVILGHGIRKYSRLLSVVSRLEHAPREWQDVWRSLLKQSRQVRDATTCDMRLSESAGPFLVRRPAGYCLVVPKSYWMILDSHQRRGVMLHELAHIERKDVWRQMFAKLIVSLHWFNPFAWWALREFENSSEFACDDRVAKDGPRSAAGFASALVEFAQWSLLDRPSNVVGESTLTRGVGLQAMAAPPLFNRISKLLQPSSTTGSTMKRMLIASLTVTLVMLSFVQLRLTTAQEDPPSTSDTELQVLTPATEARLQSFMERLDENDPTTARLQKLFDDAEGKIAIAGMLNTFRSQARDAAGSEAIPNFVAEHFSRDKQGKLLPLPETKERLAGWEAQSKRIADNIQSVKDATADVAQQLDTSTDAGGLFKRFLNDPDGPAAVLLSEMKGGDLVTRYLSEALGRMLVERADGQFVIVESRRSDANKQVDQFELAEKLRKRMLRELPLLGAEFTDTDDRHQRLKSYLNDPVTATVVALQLASEVSSASKAAAQIHEHFEAASVDKADGLHINADKVWDQLEDIYGRVDRVKTMQDRVHDQLMKISETLSTEDELTARLAAAMKQGSLAALLAAELPYAENNPGQELRQRLDAVLREEDGRLFIIDARQEELEQKAMELLRACRQIRRYTSEIQSFLDEVKDREFIESLGVTAPYLMLDLIREHAESNRPDVIQLMEQQLLVQDEERHARVREDRREVVRRLVEQAEQLRAEGDDGDF